MRKTLAEQAGVPVYAIFSNEQMAEMVTRRVETASALSEIAGVGEARVEKYGAAFLEVLGKALQSPESSAEPGDET
ncbi:HRDC domain-containing protein [Marichromatium gracile]|nr:HRDC domain-containing protein [Marichromatium gracile]